MEDWQEGKKMALSSKPLLVLITASCLCSCWVLQSTAQLISGAPVAFRPYAFTQLPSCSLRGHTGGQSSSADPSQAGGKQQGETRLEGAETA